MAQTADGVPRYVPNALVDRIVGLTAVGAICASLVDRDRTGRGQRVDIPMFETMAGFVMGDHMGGLTYEPPLDKGGYARHLSPDRRPYKTSDGYICVIVYNDKQWQNFFDATGRDDLAQQSEVCDLRRPRRQYRRRLCRTGAHPRDQDHRRVDRLSSRRPTCRSCRCTTSKACSTIRTSSRPNFFPSSIIRPRAGSATCGLGAIWSETPVETKRLAPRLSEHSAEILARGRLLRRRRSQRWCATASPRPRPAHRDQTDGFRARRPTRKRSATRSAKSARASTTPIG